MLVGGILNKLRSSDSATPTQSIRLQNAEIKAGFHPIVVVVVVVVVICC